MGGARAITVGDGRQSLDVRAEQLGEYRSLRLTQLGELGGHMRHRAVVLANLHSRTDLPGVRRIAGTGQRLGDLGDGSGDRGRVSDGVDAVDDALHPLPGKVRNRIGAAEITQLAHRRTGKIVVGVTQLAAADRRQLEPLRRPSPTPSLAERRGCFFDITRRGQRIEMTADSGGADPEPVGDLPCRQRAVLHEQGDDRSPRLPIGVDTMRGGVGHGIAPHNITAHGFHNTSVT